MHQKQRSSFQDTFTGPFTFAFLFLTLYLWALFFFQSIAYDISMGIPFFVLLLLVSLGGSFLLLKFFAGRVSAISFPAEQPGSPVWGAVAFLVTLAVFMVYFMGQYPGGMTQDTISQYSQAMGDMQYNDWHPALHTFLFFSLPMLLSKSLGWIVFLQLLYFSLAFGYLNLCHAFQRVPQMAARGFLRFCLDQSLFEHFFDVSLERPWAFNFRHSAHGLLHPDPLFQR